MMNFEQIRDITQNKNFLMCFASIIFMCGILACFYGFGIIICSVLTFLMIGFLFLRLFDNKKVLIFLLIFYVGFFLTFFKIKTHDDLVYLIPLDSVVSGRVSSIPIKSDRQKLKFFMDIESVGENKLRAKTFVTISNADELKHSLNIGEKISINAKIREPFNSTNPSQFDYSSYLRNFNVFAVIYASGSDVDLLEQEKSFRWEFLQELNNTRNRILAVHSKYLKSPNLEILGGIVFGDDAVSTPDDIKGSFVNSGLLHILAASGMNVAFIFSFWFFILQFLKVPYRPRVFSGMLIIILYTLMTGLGPSVIRAALMLLFVLAGKLIDRDTHSVSLLSLVAVLMLIYNPAYINDVSFQLSFLVTLGLLTTANVFTQKLDKIPNWLKVPIIIPLVAQIWVAPVQMFYFNTFSLYSFFANVATVSLLSVISFCGFVSSVLAIFPPLADISCKIFDFVLNYLLSLLVYISNFFAGLKYCVLQTSHPSVWQMLLYYSMVLMVTFFVKLNKYKKALLTIVVCVLVIFVTVLKPVSNKLEIIAFDVQNADSFLVKTPKNKYFMIDTGKLPFDSGNSQAKIIMLKYLKDRGIKNLEGLIVTHFDNDHSGGVPDVISNVKVNNMYLNSTNVETQTGYKIFDTAKKLQQNYKVVTDFETIYEEDGLKLRLYKSNLNPESQNESSLIALLSYNDFDMLFMGDAGVKSFNSIRNNVPNNVEVLKVGHHGGADVVDSQMLNHLGNKVSLISTGLNYFGHPNKGTLDLLRNTVVLRTDLLNSIKISTDGYLYDIYSYKPHDKNFEKLYTFDSK